MSKNKNHNFLVTLKMDGKIIATRNTEVIEFNDNVIYSLRLNQLMTEMSALITEALKDKSVNDGHRMLQRGVY